MVLGISLIAPTLCAQEKKKKDRPQLEDFLEENFVEEKMDSPRLFFSFGGSIVSVNAQEKSIEVKGTPENTKVIVNDEVKVRKRYPPNPYVDKQGKQRQPTDKELKELKGDSSLPGFAARFEDLKSACTVLILIVHNNDPRPRVIVIDNDGENILRANEEGEDKDKKGPPAAPINPRKFWNSFGRVNFVAGHKMSIGLQPGDPSGRNMVIMLDDVKIRKVYPPIAYDDKGWRREHTDKELKDLKGDLNLPGFPASFEDLRPDHAVAISMARKKIGNTTKPRASVIMIYNWEEELRHPDFGFFGGLPTARGDWWERVR
jgi:hypothetical protein